MKKHLLALAAIVALMPAVNANALGNLTEVWKTPLIGAASGTDWDSTTPKWDTPTQIKSGACTRFATVYDGKMYTVNMKTMSIAAITENGLVDTYTLPEPEDKADFYGTAIAADEAGNFLVGMWFTQGKSGTHFTVFNPKDGSHKKIVLSVPAGVIAGRTDCVNRILGDLTKDAYIFLGPGSKGGDMKVNPTNIVRVIHSTGNGTVESIEMTDVTDVTVAQNYSAGTAATQPAYHTLAEAGANAKDFYFASATGANRYYAKYIDGTLTTILPNMADITVAGTNGFDTFVINGKRYFVVNYDTRAGYRPMSVVVTDENGEAICTWEDDIMPVTNLGYSTIITEPAEDDTYNIYIFSNDGTAATAGGGGIAAKLNFDPNAVTIGPIGSENNPYKISTVADLTSMASKIKTVDFYAVLENDIDLAGVAWTSITSNKRIFFDGQNHVIKNLTITAGRASLFGDFIGEIRNLGMENVNTESDAWGLAGSLMSYAAGEVLVENCYSTGKVTAYYAGGLIGGLNTNSSATIRNCYSTATVTGKSGGGNGGGLVGKCNDNSTLVIENCYAAGTISSSSNAGGILASSVSKNITIKNVVCYSPSVTAPASVNIIAPVTGTNCSYWSSLMLNKTSVEDGKTQDELNAIVTAWPAFNDKINDGLPVLAWQQANGVNIAIPVAIIPGSKELPDELSSPQDLASILEKITLGVNYFVVTKDIDMTDVAYTAPLGNNNYSGRYIFIDGQNHVISNLTVSGGNYPSLIGVFMGEIKNLGLEDVNIDGKWAGAGAFGGFIGHSNYGANVSTIDNCYSTGTIVGSSYAGGIGGYNNGNCKISNSYSIADVNVTGNAGGLMGYNDGGTLTIEYAYAGGNVKSTSTAAGVLGAITRGSVTLNNVVAFNAEVNGATAAPICNDTYSTASAESAAAVGDEADENLVAYLSTMKVNGTQVEGGLTHKELVRKMIKWPAYNAAEVDAATEKPILSWQDGVNISGTNGIDELEAVEVDANAEYYNLQGVRVANPEGGIFIVRRGGKVTKEFVK